MKKVKISGSISNIEATGVNGISFEVQTDESTYLCIIEGTKAAILYSTLIEGDPVNVAGEMESYDGMPCIKVTSLNIPV